MKNKGIVITENLTKNRYTLYQQAITKLGKKQVWTSEGRILTKVTGNYLEIKNANDLNDINP